MRRLLTLALTLAALGCACGEDTPPATAATGTEGEGEGEGPGRHGGDPPSTVETTPERAPPARLVRSEGNVLVSSGPTTAGGPLEAGVRITIPVGGSADIDLREGTRLVLDPGTELVINDVGPAQAVLVRGGVHVAAPPEDGAREALRFVTPEVSVVLNGSGEAYVATDPSGTTWVIVLQGLFEVCAGETDARGRLRSVDVAAGHTVLATPRPSDVSETGYARLDEARAAVRTAFSILTPMDDERRVRELGAATSRLDESLGALEAEARHGHELTESHRNAVTAGNSEEARRIQGELVTHAQHLYQLREVSTARWERVRAMALGVEAHMEPDPIEVRADRVRGLLGG